MKKGCESFPTTLVFSVIGKFILKFVSQNFFMSLFEPGSCLKSLVGTPITTRSFSL